MLGQDVSICQEDSLQAFLNDFTTADLRAASLIDIDMEGVRWSECGTLWPPELNVEDLKMRSEEVGVGSGTYVVGSGSATVRDFADLA
ncbi:hypothetical protein ACFQX6_65980 [Streptosporangium lutulentum]